MVYCSQKPVRGRERGGLSCFPGAEGTTTWDKELIKAARQAALETKFAVNNEDPEQIQGTITYIFKLK